MAKFTKKFCKNGHKYTKANTYFDKNGWRTCKECKNRQRAKQYLRRPRTVVMPIAREPNFPPSPTHEIPGTEAKKVVMESRVAAGYQPHHPLDYREDKNPK